MDQLIDPSLKVLARVPHNSASFVIISIRGGKIFYMTGLGQGFTIYPVLKNGEVSRKGEPFPNLSDVDIIAPERLFSLPEVDAIQNPLRYALERNLKYSQRSPNR
ncbi:MAG: hypothetical protein QMD77_03070 [Patescibacteria group bacterium]|nr:hypothetical protein [Patescibacteria group bacterium]